MSTSNKELYDLLDCAVCMKMMYPPIYQCPGGHTICSSCFKKINNRCPTCRIKMGIIRCRALEKMAEAIEHACEYAPFGCKTRIKYSNKLVHEEQQCKFRPYLSSMPVGGTDWRGELQQDSRQRIVNKIMETLKKHLLISGYEDFNELNTIAVRFEEKIYTAATSKSDYLRKISLKMLTMEIKSNPNALPANPVMGNQGGQDAAMQVLEQRIPGQQMPSMNVPTNHSQSRPQMLPQNATNSMTTSVGQSSSNLTSSMPTMSGSVQSTLSSNVTQGSTMQNIPNLSQNSVNTLERSVLLFHEIEVMDGNNSGQNQGMENSVMAVVGGGTDRRDELSPGFRQGIMETMKMTVEESEEMIYTVARSKDDYLRTISLEMRTMGRKLYPNALPSNPVTGNQVCQDPAMHVRQQMPSMNVPLDHPQPHLQNLPPMDSMSHSTLAAPAEWQEEAHQKLTKL